MKFSVYIFNYMALFIFSLSVLCANDFEIMLKQSKGGVGGKSPLFLLNNNETLINAHKNLNNIIVQQNSIQKDITLHNKVSLFGLSSSSDGLKFITVHEDEGRPHAGYAPIICLYNIQNSVENPLCSWDVRKILEYSDEDYMGELDGIAIAPDGTKFAFIHRARDQEAFWYGNVQSKYRVSIVNCRTKTMESIDLFSIPRQEDHESYNFISFFFNPDGTQLGLYYKKSSFSRFPSSFEGFNGGPYWQTSESSEYATYIMDVK